MNISIDSRSINIHSGSGIGTYTNNLVFNLIHNSNNNYMLFWAQEINNIFVNKNTEIYQISDRHSNFYDKIYVPQLLKNKDIDLFHIPQNGIGFPFGTTTDVVVTIHDLIPYTMPETVGKGYLKRFLNDMPRIINESAGIITVSQYSKKDILRFFPECPKEKIYVTPLATNNTFIPLNKERCKEYIKKIYGIDKKFILYVGGFSSRKNVKSILKAYKKIKKDLKEYHYLVLLGSIIDDGAILKNLTYSLGINDDVIFTGYVNDATIPIFYNAAECFVYPSLYEGFGLPPLEAMSCKTPVITSNTTSIPEVTGQNCAILINPLDLYELSYSLKNVLNDETIKHDLSEKGYEKSLQYSWRLTAKKTLEAYRHIKNFNN